MNKRANIAGLAYRGRTASIGFAHGPFVLIDGVVRSVRTAGTPKDEAAALRGALRSTGSQIAALAAAAGGDGARR